MVHGEKIIGLEVHWKSNLLQIRKNEFLYSHEILMMHHAIGIDFQVRQLLI